MTKGFFYHKFFSSPDDLERKGDKIATLVIRCIAILFFLSAVYFLLRAGSIYGVYYELVKSENPALSLAFDNGVKPEKLLAELGGNPKNPDSGNDSAGSVNGENLEKNSVIYRFKDLNDSELAEVKEGMKNIIVLFSLLSIASAMFGVGLEMVIMVRYLARTVADKIFLRQSRAKTLEGRGKK